MAAERIDVSSIVAGLAQIRLHEGNRTPEINALLERADEAHAALAELIAKADNAATALSNLIAARQVDERYEGVVTDLTAALARISGEGA